MYYVYIIYSNKLKKEYVGYTQDLKLRIDEHNRRKGPFTSKGLPWQLIYYEGFIYREDAMREEKFLKTGKGRERRKYLLENAHKLRRGGRVV